MLIKGLLVNHTTMFCLQDRSMSSDCMGLELHYFAFKSVNENIFLQLEMNAKDLFSNIKKFCFDSH